MYMYTKRMFASNLFYRDRKPNLINKQILNKHGGDGKRWPLTPFPFLAPWPAAPQSSGRHHAHSRALIGHSFHDTRTHLVLKSHSRQAAPLSRHDDEWRQAVGSHSALYLAACNPSWSYRFWVLDHLCSNLSQSFHFCWIIFEPVCVFLPFALLSLLLW